MRKITADYIYPVNIAPIKNGVVHISDSGEILYVGSLRKGDEEYYKGIICPGFVNVHCHTELSYAKSKIEAGNGIDSFIGELEGLKRSITEEEKIFSIEEALLEMQENGIVAVGDIMNSDLSIGAKSKSSIQFYNFIELFGSQANVTDKVWQKGIELYNETAKPKNIIPHAPYSLSLDLFKKINAFQNNSSTITIHHLESRGEVDYFESASGPMAERFKSWGLKFPEHIPSNKRPLQTIGKYLKNSKRVLLIHNTFIEKSDLDFAKKTFNETYYGLCPNSNLYIENILPAMDVLQSQELNMCIGTDSLASNTSLSILDEIKTLKDNFDISTEELIKWATLNGARALGFESLYGSIEVGKKPGIILIDDELNLLEVLL